MAAFRRAARDWLPGLAILPDQRSGLGTILCSPPESGNSFRRLKLPSFVLFPKAARDPSILEWWTRRLTGTRSANDFPAFGVNVVTSRPEPRKQTSLPGPANIHVQLAAEMITPSIHSTHSVHRNARQPRPPYLDRHRTVTPNKQRRDSSLCPLEPQFFFELGEI